MAFYMVERSRPWVVSTSIAALSLLLASCVINTTPQPAGDQAALNGDRPAPDPAIRGALTGVQQRVEYAYALHPDCTLAGMPIAHVVTAPAHGAVTFAETQEYSNFPRGNQRYDCNKQKTPALDIYYTSATDYKGHDAFAVEILYPSGVISTRHFEMTVE